MIGSPVAAVVSDRLGRRKGMFIGAWIIIIGMILGATASHIAQFIIARFVLGFGISILTVAAPAYSMEVSRTWHSQGQFREWVNSGSVARHLRHRLPTFHRCFDHNFSTNEQPTDDVDRSSAVERQGNRAIQLWLVWRINSGSSGHVRNRE